MTVTFLGVGEACDPACFNTAILVEAFAAGGARQLLLDCGFTVPHRYFGRHDAADALDGVWISHLHGDHFFGLPLLLLRFWEMGRAKPLVVIGPPGVAEATVAAMDLAYPSFRSKLHYPLEFVVLEPGKRHLLLGCSWQGVDNEHSIRALALRLEVDGVSLYYSGDGRPAGSAVELARGADLVIHEAFRLSGETAGHGSVAGSVSFAEQAGAGRLALVHVTREERQQVRQALDSGAVASSSVSLLLPEPGDFLVFGGEI